MGTRQMWAKPFEKRMVGNYRFGRNTYIARDIWSSGGRGLSVVFPDQRKSCRLEKKKKSLCICNAVGFTNHFNIISDCGYGGRFKLKDTM